MSGHSRNLHGLSLTAMARGIAGGDFTSTELTSQLLQRIATIGQELNAFVSVRIQRTVTA